MIDTLYINGCSWSAGDELECDPLFEKYLNFDFVVWRMKTKKGKIYPDISINELLINKVGISISFKSIIEDKFFKNNGDHEDFEFVNNLQKQTKNFVITPEIYYNIRH